MSEAPARVVVGRGERRAAALPTWVKGVAPLVLLAAAVVAFLRVGPAGVFRQAFPPVEELTIERITLPRPGEMVVSVVNGGPEPVTLAQVLVDDAAWFHTLDGDRRIGRLERRNVTIPYPWVEGEPHVVTLVTSTGLTFTGEVAVAMQTPSVDARYLSTFALLGVYAGVIPVFLGLLWLPFLRSIQQRWVDFFLSFTVGLLVFLGADAIAEALEVSARVPGAFQGAAVVLMGVLATPLLLAALGQRRAGRGKDRTPLYVATLIAAAIGLHNLGEGLAIGTSYATGEIALGTFLVIGFLIHNSTEGLGIVAPIASQRTNLGRLAGLGLLAGAPTVAGAWLGAFAYSSLLITLCFAIGAGAIIQVVHEIWKLLGTRGRLTEPLNATGLVLGLVTMYVTGLLVAV